MKKGLGILLGLCLAITAYADPMKVGVVDLREVFAKAPEVKVIKENLEKRFKPRQEKLVSLQNDMKSKMEKLQKDGTIMSAADKKSLQEEIVKTQQMLESEGSKYQNDLNTAQNGAMDSFFNKVRGVIDTIAAKEKYTLILQRESVPYRAMDLDITDLVVKSLSAKA